MQPPSRTRPRFVVVTLLVAAAAAVPVQAQTASWPTDADPPVTATLPIVTVAPFQAGRSARVSTDITAALADELAAQLVESRRCRVLDQAWLPVPGDGTNGRPVQTLRVAAANAGVDYLVVGDVVPISRTIVTQPQTSLPHRPPTLSGSRLGSSPMPMAGAVPRVRPAKIRRSFLRFRLHVIDVRTGKTMDSVVVESPVRGSPGVVVGLLPIPGISLAARAVAAATAISRSSSTLDGGLRDAMASAAQTISRSWALQAGARQVPPDGRGGQS